MMRISFIFPSSRRRPTKPPKEEGTVDIARERLKGITDHNRHLLESGGTGNGLLRVTMRIKKDVTALMSSLPEYPGYLTFDPRAVNVAVLDPAHVEVRVGFVTMSPPWCNM